MDLTLPINCELNLTLQDTALLKSRDRAAVDSCFPEQPVHHTVKWENKPSRRELAAASFQLCHSMDFNFASYLT